MSVCIMDRINTKMARDCPSEENCTLPTVKEHLDILTNSLPILATDGVPTSINPPQTVDAPGAYYPDHGTIVVNARMFDDRISNEDQKNTQLISTLIHERLHQDARITDSSSPNADDLTDDIIEELFGSLTPRLIARICSVSWEPY